MNFLGQLFLFITIAAGFVSISLRLWASRSSWPTPPMTSDARAKFDGDSARALRNARKWEAAGAISLLLSLAFLYFGRD